MGISISGTTLTFNDATTMTTAATATSTTFGGIGTYAIVINTTNSSLATGSTVAGSALRYDFTANIGVLNSTLNGSNTTASAARNTFNNPSFDGGGSSLSGTWRKMSQGATFTTFTDSCGGVDRYWFCNLYVRIS